MKKAALVNPVLLFTQSLNSAKKTLLLVSHLPGRLKGACIPPPPALSPGPGACIPIPGGSLTAPGGGPCSSAERRQPIRANPTSAISNTLSIRLMPATSLLQLWMQPIIDIVVVWTNPSPSSTVRIIGVNFGLNSPETGCGTSLYPLDMSIRIGVVFAAKVWTSVIPTPPVTPSDVSPHVCPACVEGVTSTCGIDDKGLVARSPHE